MRCFFFCFLFIKGRPRAATLSSRSERHFSPRGQSPVRALSASCVSHRPTQKVERDRRRYEERGERAEGEGEKMNERRKVMRAYKPETPCAPNALSKPRTHNTFIFPRASRV